MDSKIFNSLQIDAIGEILNISLGASATAVSTMLSKRTDITTPNVSVVSYEEFQFAEIEPAIGVEITYVTGLSGSNIMLLKRSDVKTICEILMGMEIPDEEFELNEMNLSAVCEVMNQMMGASSTALSEFLGEVVNISTPVAFEIPDLASFKEKYFGSTEEKVVAYFKLKIEDAIESQFMNLMSISLAQRLLTAFGLGSDDAAAAAEPEPEPAPAPSGGGTLSQEEIEKMLAGGVPDSAPEPAPAPSGGGGTLSQEEIEKLLAGGGDSTPAQPQAPEPAPAPSGGGTLSQEEIEKMLAGGAAEPAPQPAAQPNAGAQPNMGAQPGMPPQMGMPPMGAQPDMAAQAGMGMPPMGMYGMPPQGAQDGQNGQNQMMYPPYGMYPP